MPENSVSLPARRLTVVGVLGLFILFLLPLLMLALVDISQGGEDLTLEWGLLCLGLPAIGIAQTIMLVLLWKRSSEKSAVRHAG